MCGFHPDLLHNCCTFETDREAVLFMKAVRFAQSKEDYEAISALNTLNHKAFLTQDVIQSQGFVTWAYPVALLEKMAAYAPSVICTDGDNLAGYALTAPLDCAAVHPELAQLLEKMKVVQFQGQPLSAYRHYIMGQLCVAEAYRGMGVVEMMYEFHRKQFYPRYEMMALTISTANTRSIRVHERIGFQEVHHFEDHHGAWKAYVWDWRPT